MSKFTQEELVAFIYNETNALLSTSIAQAAARSSEIKEELNQLLQVKNQLNAMSYQPAPQTVDKIMLYARLHCCSN
jgi:hypothetical protein